MEVRFATRQLERRYHQDGEAERAWGQQVGRRYRERVNQLLAAASLDGLYQIRAVGLHPLTGDLAAFRAARLTGRVRLLVRVLDARTVEVANVLDHHG